jgi:hypothetical protein
MPKKTVGKLPPKYKFLLSPHKYLKYSKCPHCNKITFARKFPLFIHVEDAGMPVILGKTCKYCSRCELIICHQEELDELLAKLFEKMKPEVIGNDYYVLGTLELNAWKKSLETPINMGQTVEHMSDIKEYTFLDYDPGGWRHKDDDGSRWIIKHVDAEARRQTPWTLGRKAGGATS